MYNRLPARGCCCTLLVTESLLVSDWRHFLWHFVLFSFCCCVFCGWIRNIAVFAETLFLSLSLSYENSYRLLLICSVTDSPYSFQMFCKPEWTCHRSDNTRCPHQRRTLVSFHHDAHGSLRALFLLSPRPSVPLLYPYPTLAVTSKSTKGYLPGDGVIDD